MTINAQNYLSPAPTASASPEEGTWDPNALSPIWADLEILGLCIALDLVFYFSIGQKKDSPVSKTVTEDICNRLTLLSGPDSQASPGFKKLAESSIEIANEPEVFWKKFDGERNLLTQAFLNSDLAAGKETIEYNLINNKSAMHLPEDDGTALLCLTLVCGAFIFEEYQHGNSKYVAALKEHPQLYVFPLASYDTVCDMYNQEKIDSILKTLNNLWFGGTNIENRMSAIWKNNGSLTFDELPTDNGQATNMYNSYVDQYNLNPDDPITPVDPIDAPVIPMNSDPEKAVPPMDPSAPTTYCNPFVLSGPGYDVVSKTDLMLEWMIDNPSNSNGAEVFLLYLSNLAEAGYFDGEDNEFAALLLSIDNGAEPPKTLVAECVDIMMMQMCLTGGYTPEQAADTINSLFPPGNAISDAVYAETEAETEVLNSQIDPKTGKVTYTQEDIDNEWETFMEDPDTISSTESVQANLKNQEIEACGDNTTAAIFVLMLMLMAEASISLDAYSALSEELQRQTDELTRLMTEWNNGTAYDSAEDAEAWMNDLQALQEDMNNTPYDDTTMDLINAQFETIYNQPASFTWANGGQGDGTYEIMVDESGDLWVESPPGSGEYGHLYYGPDVNGELTPSINYSGGPDGTLTPVTLGDMAYGNEEKDVEANPYAVQDSLQTYQPNLLDPDTGEGGVTPEAQAIEGSMEALTNPLSQQTAAVGAIIQQTTTLIEQEMSTAETIGKGTSAAMTRILQNIV